MSEVERPAVAASESLLPCPQAGEPVFRHVLACLDMSPFSSAILAHASAVASTMNARLTILHVLEPAGGGTVPTDPVEWTLRHRDAEAELRDQISRFDSIDADVVVIDGPAAECICAWVRDHDVDLTVLGVSGNSNWPFPGLGGTARRVAETVDGSVLLTPSVDVGADPIRYRRVMTPLDGSSRGESSLPIAVGIAAAHEAEILLVHAAPNVELTEIGPLEAEARALRDQLRRRNERVAEQYMLQVRSWLPLAKSCSRTRVIASGDARHALAIAAAEDQADIIVLSSTGSSGHPDISVGSVADYLINHAEKPILLVRGHEWTPPRALRCTSDSQPVRLPNRALM